MRANLYSLGVLDSDVETDCVPDSVEEIQVLLLHHPGRVVLLHSSNSNLVML